MGNQPSGTSSDPQPQHSVFQAQAYSTGPQKSSSIQSNALPIDALNSLLEIGFKKIAEHINIDKLQESSNNLRNVKGFERGKNFQGVMEEGCLNKMCRIYSSVDQMYNESNSAVLKKVFTVFFGEFHNSQRIGDGIQVKSYISEEQYEKMVQMKKLALNLTEIEVLKLDNWKANQNQKGVYLSQIKKETIIYKGNFINKHFQSGELSVLNDGRPFINYKGKFNENNQLHDKNGSLEFVGKTNYKGGFENNKRQGYGVEEDQSKNTVYIGQFYKDKKNGYGEMTYKKRENIKLKAFWNDDMVKKDEGVFVTANGLKLELMGDSTYI